MFVRLPLLLIFFIITSPCIASFHQSKNDDTLLGTININKRTIRLPATENEENFSTLLQRRILQILAHQLIDDNHQTDPPPLKPNKTHYKTKTFSVSIDTVNTAFYRVSIKDRLQNKETLIKIPR
jgi:hypothetical protein